jgi:hypothetical protein
MEKHKKAYKWLVDRLMAEFSADPDFGFEYVIGHFGSRFCIVVHFVERKICWGIELERLYRSDTLGCPNGIRSPYSLNADRNKTKLTDEFVQGLRDLLKRADDVK